MFTQVFAMQNAEEALKTIEAGADAIGFAPILWGVGRPDHKTEIPDNEVRRIMAVTEGKAQRIALSVSSDPKDYLELAKRYNPEIVHISGQGFQSDKEFYRTFRSLFPNIKLLQAIAVRDESAVAEARRLAECCDMLILDSAPKQSAVIGATGLVHDREIDRLIVESVDIPVIVAGGIGADNVEEIIRKTRPFGVDTLSRTNRTENGEKSFFKDFEKVRLFCQRAKETANALGLQVAFEVMSR